MPETIYYTGRQPYWGQKENWVRADRQPFDHRPLGNCDLVFDPDYLSGPFSNYVVAFDDRDGETFFCRSISCTANWNRNLILLRGCGLRLFGGTSTWRSGNIIAEGIGSFLWIDGGLFFYEAGTLGLTGGQVLTIYVSNGGSFAADCSAANAEFIIGTGQDERRSAGALDCTVTCNFQGNSITCYGPDGSCSLRGVTTTVHDLDIDGGTLEFVSRGLTVNCNSLNLIRNGTLELPTEGGTFINGPVRVDSGNILFPTSLPVADEDLPALFIQGDHADFTATDLSLQSCCEANGPAVGGNVTGRSTYLSVLGNASITTSTLVAYVNGSPTTAGTHTHDYLSALALTGTFDGYEQNGSNPRPLNGTAFTRSYTATKARLSGVFVGEQ